jgi:hypothetical protein
LNGPIKNEEEEILKKVHKNKQGEEETRGLCRGTPIKLVSTAIKKDVVEEGRIEPRAVTENRGSGGLFLVLPRQGKFPQTSSPAKIT